MRSVIYMSVGLGGITLIAGGSYYLYMQNKTLKAELEKERMEKEMSQYSKAELILKYSVGVAGLFSFIYVYAKIKSILSSL